MGRILFASAALACLGLWAGSASAANPYRDRHFAHYGLHDAFDLQDFNRYSYASGYPATTWHREAGVGQVKLVPPVGELPAVLLPPEYEYRRRDYEYYRNLVPGSPGSYAPPPAVNRAWQTSPSDMVSPFRSKTGQAGHDDYAP